MGTVDVFTSYSDNNEIEASKQVARLSSPFTRYNGNKNNCETRRCAWAPDCSFIAWSCGKGIVKVVPWNRVRNCLLTTDDTDIDGRPLKHDRLIRTFDAGELVYSVAFGRKETGDIPVPRRASCSTPQDPNTNRRTWYRYKNVNDLILAVGLKGGRIRTWNVRTGHVFLVLMDHTSMVQDLQFAPDNSLRLLSASRDGSLKLWHLDDDGNMSHTFRGQASQNLIACCWSPNCNLVCGVGNSRGVYLWDLGTLSQRQLKGHVNNVCGCAFSPDGVLLATASYDTSVILWSTYSGQKLCKLYHLYPPPKEWMVGGANNHYVRYLSFSPDGLNIATVCEDGVMRVWDLREAGTPCQAGDVSEPLSCCFSPNGAAIAVGNSEGTLTVWAAPRQRLNLQHMCRVTLQRALHMSDVGVDQKEEILSMIPRPLRKYAKYEQLLPE